MNDLDFSKEIRSAIRRGDISHVSALLDSYPDKINMITPFGTWLHVASRVGNLNIVKRLVELGADINKAAGTYEAGPLITAISGGYIEIVKYFLLLGAMIDFSEPFRNPIFVAIYDGRLDIVKLLVEHGVDTKVKYTGENMKDMDAIALARGRGQLEIAEFLASCRRGNQNCS